MHFQAVSILDRFHRQGAAGMAVSTATAVGVAVDHDFQVMRHGAGQSKIAAVGMQLEGSS